MQTTANNIKYNSGARDEKNWIVAEKEFRRRQLDLRTGKLTRRVCWESPNGLEIELTFERFVSMADKHVLASRVKIKPFNRDTRVRLIRGIDGRQTELDVPLGEILTIEKICAVFTSRDPEVAGENEKMWKTYWNTHDVLVESDKDLDQLAVRLAIYHLNIMADREDDRVSIGARGLTGEDYKGHVFWADRVELGEDGRYHLNDVMDPDEYKDRINDNAYTNYMARCTPQLCRSFPFGIRTWQNRGRLQPLLSVLRRGHGK